MEASVTQSFCTLCTKFVPHTTRTHARDTHPGVQGSVVVDRLIAGNCPLGKADVYLSGPWTNDGTECLMAECECGALLIDYEDEGIDLSELLKIVKEHHS